ncbi:myeloid cell surface antigen CD33-like isoform X4 [Oncorhynchus keta]|uniref:myeloid cell surface antigen CD33-like isoform X4 n=1 Tax=Oncorhynchus keta TaxID=8018 RepID=UPI00227BF814|nr:myeloid cell surface antigen CD33-like isoform X4 [Oncorhynchus keta]
MADIHHSFLGLLVTVLYLLTGVSGETLSMFSRMGDNVSLPCNNVVYPNCSSTTWIYNRALSTGTIQEVTSGKIEVDQTERADRLSLGSDCSLNVSDVRAEDVGLYTCRQYLTETGPKHGGDAPVHLSVLTISSTPPVTDLKPNVIMTLRCSLLTDTQHGTCWSGFSLSWGPKTGTKAQVTRDSSCDITLTVTLQKKDNSRKWTCTLTEKGNMKISIDFTSTFSGSQNLFLTVTVGVALAAVVCVTAVVIIVRRRRDKNQVPTDNSIGLNAVNHPTPPTNEDKSQPADRITYASIDHFNQNPPHRVNANSKDAVMYASVMPSSGRGRETENPADPSSLYSTVK